MRWPGSGWKAEPGHRLLSFNPWTWLTGKIGAYQRARRRERFEVVSGKSDKEWDEWLKKELDDETKH